ncbi:MAG: signal peptidase I [Elusimicrobia bacterium RIFOXYB1_FULL_48_9]|nr:MAG: signal peptidase I [Elusimicrobia bacterium RIFOXYB1_FULL_48_9]
MLEEKISRWLVKPKRGEIIVFKSPVDEKELIKRVIAVAGDTVEIKEKEVFINGAPAKEDYVKHTRASELLSGDNINRLTVPASTVFVMGDNRDESNDSRDWINSATGEHIYFLPLSNIKGRVIRIN